MLRLVLLTAALLSAVSVASARNTKRVMTDTNIATIGPVLREAGLFPETITIEERDALVIREDGLVTILRPRVCTPDCRGLLMYVIINGTSPANAINAFNQQTPATMAYTSGNATVLSRYLIADHGITEGTFLVNLDVFRQTVGKWTAGRRARGAISVSLLDAQPFREPDQELEDLLKATSERPELVSGRIVADY